MTTTFDPIELPSRYAKALVAILTAALGVLVTALTDGQITLEELLGVAVALVTAVGVYLVPNLPAGIGRYAKAGVAIVGTGLQAAVPLIVEGTITTSGWLMILLAVLGAVSVGITPNVDVEAHPAAETTPLVDVEAPAGYETSEVSDAKTEVVDILNQLDGEDRLTIGERQVERLIEMGWRPTNRDG